LVDRRQLLLGSANFDPWSYRFQQECLLIASDPVLVAEFERRVVTSGIAGSVPASRHGGLAARLAGPELRLPEGRVLLANPGRIAPLSRLGRRPFFEARFPAQPVTEQQHQRRWDQWRPPSPDPELGEGGGP